MVNAASYDARRCGHNLRFFTIMDVDYQEEYELAAALTCGWLDVKSDLASSGPILLLKSISVVRDYSIPGLMPGLIRWLISEVFPNGSIVVQPPWEPSDQEHLSEGSMGASDRLQFKAIPGEPGSEGWRWARYPGALSVPDPLPGEYEIMDRLWRNIGWERAVSADFERQV